MSSREVIESVWDTSKDNCGNSIHNLTGNAVESIMKCSLMRRTLDNITVAIIAFKNFKKAIISKKIKTEESYRDASGSQERQTQANELKRPLTASVYLTKPKREAEIRPETPKYPTNSSTQSLMRSLLVTKANANPINSNKSSINHEQSTSAHVTNPKQKLYNLDGMLNQKLNFKKKPTEHEVMSNNQTKLGMSRSQEFKGF